MPIPHKNICLNIDAGAYAAMQKELIIKKLNKQNIIFLSKYPKDRVMYIHIFYNFNKYKSMSIRK